MRYAIVIERAANTYSAYVPDLPGCIATGTTVQETHAQILSAIMPSAMLFVPSIGGISHHWSENTSDDDIVLGARVFTDAIARVLRAS